MRIPSMTETPKSETKPIAAEMLKGCPVTHSAQMPPITPAGMPANDSRVSRILEGGRQRMTVVSPGKKILCIEDTEETAALIAEDLRERGYSVTIAVDGHAGLGAIL